MHFICFYHPCISIGRHLKTLPLHIWFPAMLDDAPQRPWSKADVEEYMLPYVRRSPPWTAYEVAKTAFCTLFLLSIRVFFVVIFMFVIWFFAWCAMLGVPHNRQNEAEFIYKPLNRTRNLFMKTMYPFNRAMAFICFGLITVDSIHNKKNINTEMAYVVVANHLSYLDIVVLLCHFRASFVAKETIKSAPFFTDDSKSASMPLLKRRNIAHGIPHHTRANHSQIPHEARCTVQGRPEPPSHILRRHHHQRLRDGELQKRGLQRRRPGTTSDLGVPSQTLERVVGNRIRPKASLQNDGAVRQ